MEQVWHTVYIGMLGGAIMATSVMVYRFIKRKISGLYENNELALKTIYNRYNNQKNRLLVIFLLPYLYIFKSSISILFLDKGYWADFGDEKIWIEPYGTEEILLNPSIHDYLYWVLIIPYIYLIYRLNYKKVNV
jgi:hypothetical protein